MVLSLVFSRLVKLIVYVCIYNQLSHDFDRIRDSNPAVRLDAVIGLTFSVVLDRNGVQSFERMALPRHRWLPKDA